jgi:hypothetical protein
LVSAPWLFALSHQKHRFTFGDTGKLSYVMYINGIVKLPHWHGEDPLTGVPLHTTRRIHEFPSVDEFATPIAGSYPPWYDASYWDEGAHPYFDPRAQWKGLQQTTAEYFRMVSAQRSLVVGFLVLLLFAGDKIFFLRAFFSLWTIWLPALATFAIYVPVHVETRFLGAAVIVMWTCLFASIGLPQMKYSPRLWRAVFLAVSIVLGVTVLKETGTDLTRRSTNVSWQVASELQQLGLRSGDRVAVLGHGSNSEYWAHLAQVRIVADLPEESISNFWDSGHQTQSAVLDAFAGTGAKFLVTRFALPVAQASAWRSFGSHWLLRLTPPIRSPIELALRPREGTTSVHPGSRGIVPQNAKSSGLQPRRVAYPLRRPAKGGSWVFLCCPSRPEWPVFSSAPARRRQAEIWRAGHGACLEGSGGFYRNGEIPASTQRHHNQRRPSRPPRSSSISSPRKAEIPPNQSLSETPHPAETAP